MPRILARLFLLVCVCACVNLCTGEDFQNKPQETEEDFLIPETLKETHLENDARPKPGQEIIGSREIRSKTNSLWSRILNRLGKTSETFFKAGPYQTRVGRTNQSYRRLYAPATLWSKFKRTGLDGGRSADADDTTGRAGEAHKKSLSINGALSSLADMIYAEGHRRDQAAAHNLRQRLLVAGRRR